MRICRRLFLSILAVTVCLLSLSVQTLAAENTFTDVKEDDADYVTIQRAAELGIFQGRTDGSFAPDDLISRAAFVVALNRMFGWTQVSPVSGSFSDVQDTSLWYYTAVETAVAHGALVAQTLTFRPDDSITREELSVMLVRALGYSNIAGLFQEQELPFHDVDSNPGYLAMAYQLGILSGKTSDTLAPDNAAARREAAVMLVYVYDRLHSGAPILSGVVSGSASDMALHSCTVAMVPARQFTYNGKSAGIAAAMGAEDALAFRDAIQSDGGKALLGISGTKTFLSADNIEEVGASVAQEASGYDGVYLNVANVPYQQKSSLTALVSAVRENLSAGQLLYVTAEAPVWRGTSYNGYDFPALSELSDTIVLRIAAYHTDTNGVMTAPLEPLEEVYYALTRLRGTVDGEKLALLLTTTGSNGASGSDIAQLLESIPAHYSSRYASAYLELDDGSTIWYNNASAAAARVQLCSFFGVRQIVLSSLSSLGDYGSDSLLNGLTGGID